MPFWQELQAVNGQLLSFSQRTVQASDWRLTVFPGVAQDILNIDKLRDFVQFFLEQYASYSNCLLALDHYDGGKELSDEVKALAMGRGLLIYLNGRLK